MTAYDESIHIAKRERMHSLLYADELAQYKKEFVWDNSFVGAWVKDNVVHVEMNCPNVYRQWKQGGHEPQKQESQFELWLTASCIGALTALPSTEKTRILQGKTNNGRETIVYERLKSSPSFWHKMPPSWIGLKKSEQRRAAESLGWKPAMIGMQLTNTWTAYSSEWASAHTYPHCLRMIQYFADCALEARQPGVTLKPIVFEGCSWGTPQDTTLAQHLLASSIWCTNLTFVPHPNTPVLPQEQSDALKHLVAVYASLGNTNELLRSIVRGELPGATTIEQFNLPDFGMAT